MDSSRYGCSSQPINRELTRISGLLITRIDTTAFQRYAVPFQAAGSSFPTCEERRPSARTTPKGVIIMRRVMRHSAIRHSADDRSNFRSSHDRQSENAEALYRLFGLITAASIVLHWLEAFQHLPVLGALHTNLWHVPDSCVVMYSVLLTAYITSRVVTNWCFRKHRTRRGGCWVAVWWGSYFAIAALKMFVKNIELPHLLPEQCIIVLIAFSGSETLKSIFLKRKLTLAR